MPISTALQFFNDLIARDNAGIETLVSDQMHETEWLDFKSGEHLKNEKETWSEAICGFANNQGGVLIWGVDARKDPVTQIDAASDLKPVQNPAALRSRLLELLRTAVEPPLPGVQVHAVFQSGTSGAGYVVCFIPESETKPHRAELVTNKPYKIRIADAFINPSPSLLRSLFFPRSHPVIELDVIPDWETEGDEPVSNVNIDYLVVLRNTGLVSAKDIFVVVSTLPDGTEVLPYRGVPTKSDIGTGVAYDRALHPSSHGDLCVIRHSVRTQYRPEGRGYKYFPIMEPLEASFDVFAADMIPAKLKVLFGDRDVVQKRQKTAFHRAIEE